METEDTYTLFSQGLELMAEGHHRRAAIVLEQACDQEPLKIALAMRPHSEAYLHALARLAG